MGGIGLATLAPMIAIVGGDEPGQSNAVSKAMAQALNVVSLVLVCSF